MAEQRKGKRSPRVFSTPKWEISPVTPNLCYPIHFSALYRHPHTLHTPEKMHTYNK